MPASRETILQFGTGRFLRAFVDRFVQQANDEGQDVGKIVVVQSTSAARADALHKQGGAYHVVVRGYENGQLVDRVERVSSISRALSAANDWPAVLAAARGRDLKYVISNTTEAGYAVDDAGRLDDAPPGSFPAKLTRVLWERFQADGDPVTIFPCELIERNADKLLEICTKLAEHWHLPADFLAWLRLRCAWLCNLVDCIVTPGPTDHPLSATDPLLIQAEPYTLWAIERVANMPPLFRHPAIHVVDELAPYYLRKVRILNGAHTAMAAKFLKKVSGTDCAQHPAGHSGNRILTPFSTVQQVLADREATRWVRALIYEEIVPTIAYRVDDVAAFADEAFDRLRNPFLSHKLSDIAAHHAAKVAVRLRPTYDEYVKLFDREPKKLGEVINRALL